MPENVRATPDIMENLAKFCDFSRIVFGVREKMPTFDVGFRNNYISIRILQFTHY